MPSVETNSRSLRAILRVRVLCLGLMILLLWIVEDVRSSPAILLGWELLAFGACLSLVYWVLAKVKRFSGILLPGVFLMDSLLMGVWVAVSGGAASFYLPFFLLFAVAASLALTPRKAAVILAGILAVFLASLFLSYEWGLPRTFGAETMNPLTGFLLSLPDAQRGGFYERQALRWVFLFLMTVLCCAILMRQVWAREEHLRTRERELEQKRHLIQMGEMTGRLAHGVNTPLALISGNLELLMAETPKGGKVHRKLSRIGQYVQRAIRTVRDILDYGRRSMSEIRPVHLAQVVQAAVSAVAPKLKKAGGRLVLDVARDLPPVLGYPEGLFQVLLNLLENAVDSIGPGGIVTLSADFQLQPLRLSREDRRGKVRLMVRDTGRGIPPEALKRIFEPFYSTKGFGKGTGLGLSIVKRILDEHQGTITAESRPGEGTIFTLLLPSEGGPSPEDLGYNEGVPAAPRGKPGKKPGRKKGGKA